MESRDPDWKLNPIFKLALDVGSGDDGVEPPNLCDGLKGEIPRQYGDEHLHFQNSKSPPDAGARTVRERHDVCQTGVTSW